MSVFEKAVELLRSQPDYAEILSRIVEYEQQHYSDEYFHIGWSWDKVGVPGHILYQLAVKFGILRVVSTRSRGPADYLLVDRREVERALEYVEKNFEAETEEQRRAVPEDLFSVIVGHDRVKELLWDALRSDRPCHVLLVGPPASAKSLFLSELDRLPNSHYALGGSTSSVGIAEEMFNYNPRYLIIDEIDDMPMHEQSVLKSLMESGVVTKRKYRIRERGTFKTWVFAGCNDLKRLSDAVKSRFIKVRFQPYTAERFREVVVTVLTMRECVNQVLAEYIAERVGRHTRDPREAIALARVAETEASVDKYVELLWGQKT